MRLIMKCLVPSIFVVLCCACAFASSQNDSACTPSFPLRAPWLGADAAYSIPLPDGRDAWIFGDTLFGDKRVVNGDDPRMVHNSIGTSTCQDGQWKIDYTIRHDAQGKFVNVFESQNKDTWYWALDGVYLNHELWVTLLCVRNAPNSGSPSAALGFEICGTDLARVTNLSKTPQDWQVSYFSLVPDGVHAYPSASTIIDESNLYIFTLDEKGSRPEILVRIPLSALRNPGKDDPKKNLQYLGSDDQWHAGLAPEKAKTVMHNGASEMSVRYHAAVKKWIAVQVDGMIFSDKVLMRTAPNLIGPWPDGDVIYRIPELQKGSQGYDPDTFCYAGKEHPEFEKPGELVFTYVCNSMKPKKLESEDIYYPKVVRMPMPASANPKAK